MHISQSTTANVRVLGNALSGGLSPISPILVNDGVCVELHGGMHPVTAAYTSDEVTPTKWALFYLLSSSTCLPV